MARIPRRELICLRLAVEVMMCASVWQGSTGAESEYAIWPEMHVIERAENEVYPDALAQMIVGWRVPRIEQGMTSRPRGSGLGRSIGRRATRVDFVERVREFLDIGLD